MVKRSDLRHSIQTSYSYDEMYADLTIWMNRYDHLPIFSKGYKSETVILNRIAIDEITIPKIALVSKEIQMKYEINELDEWGIKKYPDDQPHFPLEELRFFIIQINKLQW